MTAEQVVHMLGRHLPSSSADRLAMYRTWQEITALPVASPRKDTE